MSNGSHLTGPIVSGAGFKNGTKASNNTVIDSDGNLYHGYVKLTDTAATLNKTKTFSETIVFDSVGAAGTYTGDVSLPAGAMIENIIVHNVTKCDQGTSATMIVGDYSNPTTAIDADGFFAAIDVKTALDAGESIDFYRTGGKHGAYLPMTTDPQHADSKINKRYSATARIIRGLITTDGANSTAGKQLMTVIYSVPVPVSSVFAT